MKSIAIPTGMVKVIISNGIDTDSKVFDDSKITKNKKTSTSSTASTYPHFLDSGDFHQIASNHLFQRIYFAILGHGNAND